MTQAIGKTSTEERALKLLGMGHSVEVVASAIGVSASRISQLMSDENFAAEVTELKFQHLQKHNELDNEYDEIEGKLVRQLKTNLPLIQRPMELLKAITVINAAKRKGQSAPEAITHQQTVVNLFMPTKIVQKFTTNVNNQVIQAGTQQLETVQSSALPTLASKLLTAKTNEMKVISHESSQPIQTADKASSSDSSDS